MSPYSKSELLSYHQAAKVESRISSIPKGKYFAKSTSSRVDRTQEVVLKIDDSGGGIMETDGASGSSAPDREGGLEPKVTRTADGLTSTSPPRGALDKYIPGDIQQLRYHSSEKNGDGFPRSVPSFGPDNAIMQEKQDRVNLWREVSCDYLKDPQAETGRKKRNARKQRPKSFDFGVQLDPTTKLIGDFLERQKASGDLSLDMDIDMEELSITDDPSQPLIGEGRSPSLLEDSETNTVTNQQRKDSSFSGEGSSRRGGSSRKGAQNAEQQSKPLLTVSFGPAHISGTSVVSPSSEARANTPSAKRTDHSSHTSSSASSLSQSSDTSSDEAETLRSSRLHSLSRGQSRSRLADPPLPLELRQNLQNEVKVGVKSAQLKSTQLRSGLLAGKTGFLGKVEEEEDDPLKDSDLPEKFTKHRWNFISLFEWAAFVIIMGVLVCSLAIPSFEHKKLWSMALWKWDLLVLLVFCGRLVAGWIIRIIVLCLERSFLLRKRVLYFVYAVRKGAQNCLWFAFALLAWHFIFDPKVESRTTTHQKRILSYVTKILYCALIAAVIWLVKIFLVKVLASSFHVNTYFDRIQESLFSQYVVQTLSGPPLIELEQNDVKLMDEVNGFKKAGIKVPELLELPKKEPAGQKGDRSAVIAGKSGVIGGKSGMMGGRSGLIATKRGIVGTAKSGVIGTGKSGLLGSKGGMSPRPSDAGLDEDAITTYDLHRLNQKNISAWNMKRLIHIVKNRGIATLAHVIDESANDKQDVEIQSEWQARVAAKKIFRNVSKPGSRCITKVDLMRFMSEEDVVRAISLFEGAVETGKITKNALKNFTVFVFRERRALALSLNDTKTAVKKLHRMLDVIVCIIIVIICLLILGIATTHLLLFLSSQVLLMVFIFGNTCKNVFEALVFLFVMHPFDVGDRCIIDGNQMVVEEMNILSTSFMRYDGERIWYPNSLLATKAIFNYGCTPDTGAVFNFSIHISTPVEKITALTEKIGRYIQSKPSHWTSDYKIIVQEIEDMNTMKMQLQANHTINFHDDSERQIRRSNLILELKKYFEELEIEYRPLPQDVRLRDYRAP